MVEKVSEVKVNAALNNDSVSDDRALLEWVDKKKKQNANGEPSSPVTLSGQMLVQLLNGALTSGGLQQKETRTPKAAMGQDLALPFGRSDEGLRRKLQTVGKAHKTPLENARVLQLDRSDDGMRGKASAQREPSSIKPSMGGEKTATAIASTKDSDSSVRTALNQAATLIPATQPDASAISSTALLQSSILNESAKKGNAQHKDELSEAKPVLVSGKMPDFSSTVESQRQVQNKNVPATLQHLKGQVSTPSAAPSLKEAQTVEVDYTFGRWSGDHSVKVSIPAQALREGNMTLLPSDTRAADVLSRNLNNLTGHSPELLQPRQDRDEQQKREQQPQQDEEQE